MVLRPANLDELTTSLAAANERGEPVGSFDLAALNRLLEHKPEDMTATAEAGLTLAEFQKQLATRGQWLAVDPPNAERLTLGALLATNASGPRRFGCGTVRDYVIGLKVALADGKFISPGGKVVKNVAGYDLGKLFIGSRGTLGVIVEVTFMLRPLPETERFVQARCESLEDSGRLLEKVLDSDLAPVVVDLHKLSASDRGFCLVLGFAGTGPDVEWQLGRAASLGVAEPATLDYERTFWSAAGMVQKISVLPSRLIETLREIPAPFVARAGNGIVYHRGATVSKPVEPLSKLSQRLKQTWDPKNILPSL